MKSVRRRNIRNRLWRSRRASYLKRNAKMKAEETIAREMARESGSYEMKICVYKLKSEAVSPIY